MITYILHTSNKIWEEAEKECPREGGNLATVVSQEVQEIVEKLADKDGGDSFWLGGTKYRNGEWRWTDNSTWEFSKFGFEQQKRLMYV